MTGIYTTIFDFFFFSKYTLRMQWFFFLLFIVFIVTVI